MRYHEGLGSHIFDLLNYLLLGSFAMLIVLPLMYVFLAAFATNAEIDRGAILPMKYTFDAFRAMLKMPHFLDSYWISIKLTAVGTGLSMIVSVLMAYPLSRKELPGRKLLLFLLVMTMMFNVGMIPRYLIVKSLGLINSLWALIIPSMLSPFIVLLLKNFFLTIPDELQDAARLDGCSDLGVLVRVVLPLSKPALATFTLMYGVGYWNSYFNAVLYINDPNKWPLQVVMQQLLSTSQITTDIDIVRLSQLPYPQTLRSAVLITSIFPILVLYPFVQHFFVKGLLVGSMKE